MSVLLQLLIVAASVFGVNVIPAFAPPTWMLLVYFEVSFAFPIPVLVVVGAASALLGRLVLALAFRKLGSHLPARQRQRSQALGHYLSSRPGLAALFLVFVVSPLPSNSLFEAAGLARLRLGPVGLGFLIGRLVSYSFYLVVASRVAVTVQAILEGGFSAWQGILLGVLGIASVIAVVTVDWTRVFERLDRAAKHLPRLAHGRTPRHRSRATHQL